MTADPGEQQRLDRLRQFIVLDASISVVATFYVLGVYVWVERTGWLLVAAAWFQRSTIAMVLLAVLFVAALIIRSVIALRSA